MFTKVKDFFKKETVCCIAFLLVVVSMFFIPPSVNYFSYIDFRVLALLFSLMAVVRGFSSIGVFTRLGTLLLHKVHSLRTLAALFVFLCFFFSMLITNDVALITFVPFTILVLSMADQRQALIPVIVLETIAANLGSMLTPPGNPQNLFLYAHYAYTAGSFFAVMAVPGIISLAYLLLLLFHGKDSVLKLELPKLQQPPKGILLLFLGLLLLNIGAVLHWFDKLWALLLTAGVVALCDWRRLREVDYSLLVTFAGFFVFIGNISHSPAVSYLQQSLMGSAAGTYLTGLLASQFLSNVPAAMLLAGLTKEADALLLGVNIGGLGTMIASMASVISYKLYAAEHPSQAGKYVRTFLYYNFLGLLLIGGAVYFLL